MYGRNGEWGKPLIQEALITHMPFKFGSSLFWIELRALVKQYNNNKNNKKFSFQFLISNTSYFYYFKGVLTFKFSFETLEEKIITFEKKEKRMKIVSNWVLLIVNPEWEKE